MINFNKTVAWAAVHQTIRWKGEDTGLYVVALDDGTIFVNRQQPDLYDRNAGRVSMQEVSPGTRVNISYRIDEDRVTIVEAIQILWEPAFSGPFKPVPADEDSQ